MGRIRSSTVKKLARELSNRGNFTTDFEKNKQILKEMNLFDSKRLRNKVAGYIVRVIKNRKI